MIRADVEEDHERRSRQQERNEEECSLPRRGLRGSRLDERDALGVISVRLRPAYRIIAYKIVGAAARIAVEQDAHFILHTVRIVFFECIRLVHPLRRLKVLCHPQPAVFDG